MQCRLLVLGSSVEGGKPWYLEHCDGLHTVGGKGKDHYSIPPVSKQEWLEVMPLKLRWECLMFED
jgi:hypothetical protein